MQFQNNKEKGIINRRTIFIVFVVLSLLWTAFIFSHSLQDATVSKATSGRVVDIVVNAFKTVGIKVTETGDGITVDNISFWVRKTAHFLEFAILGALSFFAMLSIYNDKKALLSLCYPVIVAICDETIQSFRPGRSNQLSDVILDISGAIVAILLCFLLVKIYKQKRSGRKFLDKTENIGI